MLPISTQTQNVIDDKNPLDGFMQLKRCGFDACDFSLNGYLKNTNIYAGSKNRFFDPSVEELKNFFTPHKEAAKQAGVDIYQMHMPYPIFVPGGKDSLNDYLWNEVAPKSMEICNFLECKYIVIHGFKLKQFLGSEEAEWEKTEEFIRSVAEMAVEYGITVCIENIWNSTGNHIIEGPCCDANKAVERIDRINEEYKAEVLGFCFDTGHANLIGIDFEKFITTLGDRLKVLHIHDNDGISDLHQIPFTFTRTRESNPSTDWDGFLQGLKNINFSGTLSFETAPVLKSFPVEMKEDALKFIATIGRWMAGRI